MGRLKAMVRNGHVVSAEPVDLPEGTPLEIEVVEPEDELDTDELARLDEQLERSRLDEMAGRLQPADEIIRKLRASR